ncbi:aldehyde dehydrogenase family protein [Dasania sp. GY-MA-18]|uniref:Aldehyde dehydrogenase family protein n=1 Tax=Dasania phycosphaerae TaxID=2950436 RepID=A0A9J6RMW3_9GAMM|nr:MULTISPECIES: aldehyde dehydrogenase family protein [Dasania]MCR8923096.1 aldehyde dehydrogenase family protein [Dasania sp. GY-MA-18]MCZ0865528.1 aldehyde dehydrogenase family protein [Dasania phycosphaerae]MCZ0869253.1 aldehyde dehydrogenase family protein [Dasania phycosphaerae]
MSGLGLIINGKRVATAESFDVINPATEQSVAQCPQASQAHVDQAVAAARAAFTDWSQVDDQERKAAVHKIADLLEEHAVELTRLITQEQGKPLQGFAGLGSEFELAGAVAWCRTTAELDLPVKVLQDDETQRVELHRKPLGVVGSITPWNWPLLIAIWHVIPAIRSGNTVVLKPSPFTPLATLRFVELANQVLPAGVLNSVTGGGDIGSYMSAHEGINKMVFTGSTATGKKIMQGAASNLKRLTLELGGNDAGIVLPDVDVDAVAMGIFATAFINAGQTCAALKRLYVHEDVYEPLCAALKAIADSTTLGNGLDTGVDFGPVQNPAQLKIVESLARDAEQQGGRFLSGGHAPQGPGFFFPITLVADVTDGCRLVDEEPFGPILPIIKYSDIDDAIRRANNNACGLGGSIWSSDIKLAAQLANRLECGTVWINNHAAVQPNVPFGGVKQSGFGVEFGSEGLEEYTSIQSVFIPK